MRDVPAYLTRKVMPCASCLNAKAQAEADAIAARFAAITTPLSPTLPAIPRDVKVTRLPAKIAAGARKVRAGGGGAQPTSAIAAQADRRALLNYAARR